MTNNGNANVEYYPRINDISNAGRVYIFGACFNSRNQNTCAVPSDTHPAGCKDATAGSVNEHEHGDDDWEHAKREHG